MNNIEHFINLHLPKNVSRVKIDSVVDYIQPSKFIVESTKYNDEYETPVLTAGQTFILGYTNEKEGIFEASKEKPVIIFDDFTAGFHWVDFPFKVKSSAMKILIPKNDINFRYFYHFMRRLNYSSSEHSRLWIGTYSQFEIPLPSRKIQDKIAQTLDELDNIFDSLISKLNYERKLKERELDHFKQTLLSFDESTPRKTIGDVCDTITDYTAAGSFADIAKNVQYSTQTNYAMLVRTMDIKSNFSKGNPVYINKHAFEYLWRVNLDKESLILPNIGNCGEVYYIKPEELPHSHNSLGPNAILVRSSNVKNKFLYYIFQSNDYLKQLNKIITPIGQTKFNKTDFKKIIIPIPEEATQEKIISTLEKYVDLWEKLDKSLLKEIEMRKNELQYYREYIFDSKGKK